MSPFGASHLVFSDGPIQMLDKFNTTVTVAPATDTIADPEKGPDEAVESLVHSNEPVDVPDGGLWAWMAVLGGYDDIPSLIQTL